MSERRPLPPDLAALCSPEDADLTPYPCPSCGAAIVRPHPAIACVEVLRDEVARLRALVADELTRHIEDTEGYGCVACGGPVADGQKRCYSCRVDAGELQPFDASLFEPRSGALR